MPPSPPDRSEIRHASAVAIDGCAVLIEGPSGSGKSALALQLMAFGAKLIADDATLLMTSEAGLLAAAPPSLPQAIECRGIGLIRAELAPPAPLVLAVDLSVTETQRLPDPGHILLLGQAVPMLGKVDSVHFPAGILQYVRGRGTLPP